MKGELADNEKIKQETDQTDLIHLKAGGGGGGGGGEREGGKSKRGIGRQQENKNRNQIRPI